MKTKRKILLAVALTFALAVVLTSCGGGSKQKKDSSSVTPTEHGSMSEGGEHESSSDIMHKQHSGLAENFAHKDIVILEEKYPVGKETQNELEQVIDAYLRLKDALVSDDEEAVNIAVGLMAEKASAVVPEQLEGEGLEAWQNHKTLYDAKLKEMKHISGLENKRSYFSHLSEIMYCTIKSFGLKQGNLFAAYCPMALDNKGAYWISDSKEIRNPYMGAKMPTCGEIKEEL